MLPRNLTDTSSSPSVWQELSEGAPTITGFAQLCSRALFNGDANPELDLISPEGKTILVLAAERGTMEIRAHRDNFDSVERFLAVCIEHQPERRLLFLQKEDPRQTIQFLDGFRELCQAGLVMHHLHRDFSLSRKGFEIATTLDRNDYHTLIKFAMEID